MRQLINTKITNKVSLDTNISYIKYNIINHPNYIIRKWIKKNNEYLFILYSHYLNLLKHNNLIVLSYLKFCMLIFYTSNIYYNKYYPNL